MGPIDGVIANAALLGSISPLPHISPDEFAKVYNLNVTSTFRLIRSMDLLLRQSDAGRLVAVSSGAAKSGRAFWGLYASTKAAVDVMVKSYAHELDKTSVNANVSIRGIARTAMRAKAVPGEDPMSIPHPDEIAPKLVDLASPACTHNCMLVDVTQSEPQPL